MSECVVRVIPNNHQEEDKGRTLALKDVVRWLRVSLPDHGLESADKLVDEGFGAW